MKHKTSIYVLIALLVNFKDILTRLPASTNKQINGFLPQNWCDKNED